MMERGPTPFGKRRAVVALGATLLVAGSVLGMTVAAASPAAHPSQAGPVTTPTGPKSAAPMNINPDKTPNLNPPPPGAVVHGPALSIAEQRALAEGEVAKDPKGTVACFFADGSVAGVVKLDRVHPDDPITNVEASQICTRGWTGSTPTAPARP
jgi:hypothetical protein